MGKPILVNEDLISAAGIDPKSGYPIKCRGLDPLALKANVKKLIRINDEQICINRFKWNNLPNGLTGQLIEKILYLRGEAVFFYEKYTDKFYFLPFSQNGEPDCYGRPLSVTPLVFNGYSNTDTNANGDKKSKVFIPGLTRKPIYAPISTEDGEISDDFADTCVLLSDYSKQKSNFLIPREQLNDPIIDIESECLPFLRTSLLNSTGVLGMKVNSAGDAANVKVASQLINLAALSGDKYIPIIGQVDFQELTGGQIARAEEFLMSMQAIDNFRLSTIGLENGGLFQKKAHELQSENDMNSGAVGPVMKDCLALRQQFCDIVNSIRPLNMSVEIDEDAQTGEEDMIQDEEPSEDKNTEVEDA